MTPKLNASIIEAQTGFEALAAKLAELQRMQDLGNVSRIGNAAWEAQTLALELAADLAITFDRATRLQAAQYTPPPAEPFLPSSERSALA